MVLIFGLIYMLVLGAVSATMVVLFLKGTREKYNGIYLLCGGAVVLWCSSQVLILLAKTQNELMIAYAIGNLGICFIGTLLYHFSIMYTNKKLSFIEKYLPILLSSFHYVMMLTNKWHHLYYSVFKKGEIKHNIFFYSNAICTYILVVLGAVILYRALSKRNARTMARGLIVASVVVPLLLNLIYLTMVNKTGRQLDITAIGFGCSVIFMLFATIKYRFMEVNITAFDVVLSSLQDGVGIFDYKGNASYFNHMFEELLGINKEKEERMALQEVLERLEEFQIIEQSSDREETLYQDDKGTYLQMQIYHPSKKDKTIVYVIKDMSKYYELIAQTRELAITNEKLVLEKERNRIAQQVHDTAGHTLTMIQSYMKLAEVSCKNQEGDKVEEYLMQAKNLSTKGIRELRQSINQLRKEAEYELVTQGIMQLVDQVREIEVTITVQGEDSEKYSHMSRVIYDSVREIITNTLKYAYAKKLEIIVRFQEENIELILADDGVGCEKINENNGIRGIRERIEKEGGNVRFLTSKGEGFLTRISLPIVNR